MRPSIQATLPTYRRGRAPSIPLPNLNTYLVGADEEFYYGTRGRASRRATLCLLAHMPHDSADHLTSVEINMAGSFRSTQTQPSGTGFSSTVFFYVEQARAHEIRTISEEWRDLVQSCAATVGQPCNDEERKWAEPRRFMVEHPEGAALLFERFPGLRILGLPMRTTFGEIVMVTMFRKSDASCLIRWVDVSMETVDVTLETPDGTVTLAKREAVDPRYRCAVL